MFEKKQKEMYYNPSFASEKEKEKITFIYL